MIKRLEYISKIYIKKKEKKIEYKNSTRNMGKSGRWTERETAVADSMASASLFCLKARKSPLKSFVECPMPESLWTEDARTGPVCPGPVDGEREKKKKKKPSDLLNPRGHKN